MLLELIRDGDTTHNWGKFFVDGKYLCETLEDNDQYLEIDGTQKVPGQSAIPRGRYRVTLTLSRRFGKIMPLLHDVPGFDGVRFHGGNTEANTEGCPLLGAVRTKDGIAQCAAVNQRLIMILQAAEQRGEDVWIDVT